MNVTNLIITVVFLLALILMIWNIARVRGYQRDYGYNGEIPGRSYECELRIPDAEVPVRCIAGATDSALYLASPKDQHKKKWWQSWGDYRDFRRYYRTDLRIPWTDLQCRSGKMFFKEVIWFENRKRRFYVYVPRDIGEKLLTDAGRDKNGIYHADH